MKFGTAVFEIPAPSMKFIDKEERFGCFGVTFPLFLFLYSII